MRPRLSNSAGQIDANELKCASIARVEQERALQGAM